MELLQFVPSSIYWFSIALALALLEIEIEGENGWAERLPTWYEFKLPGVKPITGYHLFLGFLLLLLFHTPALFTAWGIESELSLVSKLVLVLLTEDFLWFILNPNYGIESFRKEEIWWYSGSRWILDKIPAVYLSGYLASSALIYITFLHTSDKTYLYSHLATSAVFLGLISGTALLAPRYHSIYRKLRENDDSDKIEDIK